ncbi:MAG TPA: hypothetical protein VKN36_13905, partial [Eudoraea sp.]|nr:hypothetical protein [Eudoraea sp.]
MAKNYMTPGVYIEEVNAFPGSVVEVATAIPAFIGYTATAADKGKSLVNQPKRITSLKEYNEYFGGGFNPKFILTKPIPQGDDPKHKMTIGSDEVMIDYKADNECFFYNSLRLFYANGGSACYIVSVKTFDKHNGVAIDKDELLAGLDTLLKEQEPTMIVVPEAVKLGLECYEVYKKVLAHCNKMQSRVAVLDIFDGDQASFSGNEDNRVEVFREKIGTEYLNYSAAYYPWLDTNVVGVKEIRFSNFDTSEDLSVLNEYLTEPNAVNILTEFPKNDDEFKARFAKDKPEITDQDEIAKLLPDYKKNKKDNLHWGLYETSPTYKNILTKLREILNRLPPSSAMAGVYTMVDDSRGVWKSPANISLNGVVKPSTNITHDDQQKLNVDATAGKSINAIRT